MAELEPVPAIPSTAVGSASTLDESTQAELASDRPKQYLYIHDHTGKKYTCVWDLGTDWAQFKSFVEEIYAHRGVDEDLDAIRHDKFDVKHRVLGNDGIVLPSAWSTVIKPGDTVRIALWSSGSFTERVQRPRPDEWDIVDVDERRRTSDLIRPPPAAPPRRRSPTPPPETESESESEDDEESETEVEEEESEPLPPPEPVRVPTTPVDLEGNELSVTVDVEWGSSHPHANGGQLNSGDLLKKPSNGREMTTESLRITKARTSSEEGRTAVQVYTLPGPESSAYSDDIGIRWYHLHSEQLDWAQFKAACLNVPGLSERVQNVILKTLQKVEKEKVKAFLDGMFIEPGTVLRGDESPKPDAQSVIFTCVPYFEIRELLKTTGQSDRLHPPRTLIQSYYPYEPVRDRDDEQAFRKFGNGRNNALVHVPSLWMLNISSHTVVTCGYQPLSSEFVNSIEVFKEALKQPVDALARTEANTEPSIRLADREGRTLLYSLNECKTYFEMEQRIRELTYSSQNPEFESVPYLAWTTQEKKTILAKPRIWPGIVRQRNRIFIHLSVVDEKKSKELDNAVASSDPKSERGPLDRHGDVPPFFDWPFTTKTGTDIPGLLTPEKQRSIDCLEFVEKAMVSESLDEYQTTGLIDETFTSSKYYVSIAEVTTEGIKASLLALSQQRPSTNKGMSHLTYHQTIVESQHSNLAHKAEEFVRIVQQTLELFVSGINESSMLRKLWGAMANMLTIVEKLGKIDSQKSFSKDKDGEFGNSSKSSRQIWHIRAKGPTHSQLNLANANFEIPLPKDDELAKSVKKCKLCKQGAPFPTQEGALEHIRDHAKSDIANYNSSIKDDERLKDWIRSSDELLIEAALFGAHTIMEEACNAARGLFDQLQELADGVMNEEGKMSESYKFPRPLLGSLRLLIVFYLAVERSLHYTKENFDNELNDGPRKRSYPRRADVPWTDAGIDVLKRFSEGARRPILQARANLCDMVRLSGPNILSKRLSLSPEYLCSWFIRRLIVKPLDRSMTIADMYREYLSTLQFQVNHRPNKRLLRSINLLQEELIVLTEVNSWQTKLITNYIRVLDDATYPADIPSRSAMYPMERLLLKSCLESLSLTSEEYADQIRRCGPLSETTKQSSEINEEDHGKAILVFTVVTIIFLPLSFVTSYLGMNTSDIRDLKQTQTLFWEIAIPLTAAVMGSILFIAYNGDELRDSLSSVYRSVTGKQDRSLTARGISVAQRKRAVRIPADSSSTSDYRSLADEAEYAVPHPEYYTEQNAMPAIFEDSRPKYTRSNRIKVPGEWALEDELAELRLEARRRKTPPAPNVTIYNTTRMDNESSRPRIDRFPTYSAPARTDRLAPPSPLPVPRFASPNDYNVSRATYIRIHRNHVLPETLDTYGLPWEIDPKDSDFYLIKQNLDKEALNALCAHTKNLKTRRAAGHYDYYPYGGRTPERRDEYVWVKHKDRKARRRGNEPIGRRGASSTRRRYPTAELYNAADDEWYSNRRR